MMRRFAPVLALLCVGACRSEKPAAAPATTAAAPGNAGAPAGPRAESKAWTVALEAPAGAAEGRVMEGRVMEGRVMEGRVVEGRVVLTARGTFHVNRDYPHAFRRGKGEAGDERVSLKERATYSACESQPEEPCTLVAPVPIPAGARRLEGVVAFSVCDKERCLIEKVPLAVDLP